MEKDSLRSNANNNVSISSEINWQTTSDFVLQWGNGKRLRCMKVQAKDDSTTPVHKTTVRVDRRVVRTDNKDPSNQPSSTTAATNPNNHTNGYFNLRQRPSPPPPPPPQRILRWAHVYGSEVELMVSVRRNAPSFPAVKLGVQLK